MECGRMTHNHPTGDGAGAEGGARGDREPRSGVCPSGRWGVHPGLCPERGPGGQGWGGPSWASVPSVAPAGDGVSILASVPSMAPAGGGSILGPLSREWPRQAGVYPGLCPECGPGGWGSILASVPSVAPAGGCRGSILASVPHPRLPWVPVHRPVCIIRCPGKAAGAVGARHASDSAAGRGVLQEDHPAPGR